MYNEESQEEYFLYKAFVGLMYDNDGKYYEKSPFLFDLDALQTLKKIISNFVEENSISLNAKSNIYMMLSYISSKIDRDYPKRVKLCNDIITIMRSQEYYSTVAFYQIEALKRRNKLCTINTDEEKRKIEKSLLNDYLVLLSHSEKVPAIEFFNRYLPLFINNDLYYESLNAILKECPSMFKDELFMKRVKYVLSENKKISKKNTIKNWKISGKIRRSM